MLPDQLPDRDNIQQSVEVNRAGKSASDKMMVFFSGVVFFCLILVSAGIANREFNKINEAWQSHKQILVILASISNLRSNTLPGFNEPAGMEMTYCPPVNSNGHSNSAMEKGRASSFETENATADQRVSKPCSVKCKEHHTTVTDPKNPGRKLKTIPCTPKNKLSSGNKHFGVGLRFTI